MDTQILTNPGRAGEGLRRKLIGVALAILERDGIEALTLRAVARGAGVSHGAPARHFDNLDDLKAEVAAEGYKLVADEIQSVVTAAAEDTPARDLLVMAAGAYVRYALANPGLFSLVIRTDTLDLSNENLRRERRSASGRFLTLVKQAQAAGWEPETDSNLLATSLWASVHGLSTLWMYGAYQQANPHATLDEAIAGVLGLS